MKQRNRVKHFVINKLQEIINYLRNYFYTYKLKKLKITIGENSKIIFPVEVEYGKNIKIGNNCFIHYGGCPTKITVIAAKKYTHQQTNNRTTKDPKYDELLKKYK